MIATPPKKAVSSATLPASAADAAPEVPLLDGMGATEGLAGAERVLERNR